MPRSIPGPVGSGRGLLAERAAPCIRWGESPQDFQEGRDLFQRNFYRLLGHVDFVELAVQSLSYQ